MGQQKPRKNDGEKQENKLPVLKHPLPRPSDAVLKERAWGDCGDAPDPEPYEETYRDGSMKNECW